MRKIFFWALLVRLFLIFAPAHPDIGNHVDWGNKFWEYGPKDFYEQIFWGVSWPNQPIGSMLLFAGITKVYNWVFQFLWYLNLKIAIFPSFIFPFLERNFQIILLKIPFVLADLGIGILVYKIIKDLTKQEKLALLGSGLFLFSPALIYNSAIWGQTDSLVNFLGLLGLWGVWKKRFFWGILGYLGSLYFKLSLIIFVPLFGLMFWQKLFSSPRRSAFAHLRGVFRLFFSVVGAMSVFLLISLPFVHHGNVVSWLWYLYTNRILPRQGEMLSGNAFNFWTLFYGVDLSLKETIPFLGLTAKIWGKLLFFIPSGLATLFLALKKKNLIFQDFLSLGIIYAFSAFLFLTNMHERYLYPVFPLLAILVLFEKRLLKVFIILSFIYLVNLYNLWWYPRWEIMVGFLTGFNNFLPRLLSLVNMGIFFVVLRLFYENEKKLA